MDKRIISIDDYVHVVDGKVICFDNSVFDLDNEKDMSDLLCLADELYAVPDLPKRFGDNTVCVLQSHNDGTGEFTISIVSISDLSEQVQNVIKERNKRI